jgi:hypothetical protein
MLSGQPGTIMVRANGLARLIDACEVYARCQALFAYARDDVAQAPPTISAGDVARAAFLITPGGPLQDEVTAEINRFAATSTWPK